MSGNCLVYAIPYKEKKPHVKFSQCNTIVFKVHIMTTNDSIRFVRNDSFCDTQTQELSCVNQNEQNSEPKQTLMTASEIKSSSSFL